MLAVRTKKSLAVVALLAILALPSSLPAQTVLNIPRVISAQDLFTGLAIGNPAGADVAITFTAYQPDGTALTGVTNPVTLTIPASGQLSKTFSDIFGTQAPFNGWIQASSGASGLSGFFLNSNFALTDLDGSGAVDAASEFVLPLASSDGPAVTELSLVNVNADPAAIDLTLYRSDGSTLSAKNIVIPSRGLIRQTVAAVFGADLDFSGASHVRVHADRPVVGYEVVANYLAAGSNTRREIAAAPGLGIAPSTRYALPQFVTGGGWLSLVGLVNGAGVSQQVTLTAYKEDGTLWNSPSNPVKVTLNANGGLRTNLRNLFGFSDDALRTGWVQASASVGFLSSYIASGNTATPSFALIAGVDASLASRFETSSQVAPGSAFYSGLTVVNPGQAPASVELFALRPDGSVAGKSTFNIGPNQRAGGLFEDLLPSSLNQAGSWAFMRSSQPLIGTVLLGTANGAALSGVPLQPAPPNFQPPAQKTATVTGTTLAVDKPISGVQISLSGPVVATAVTDTLGRYIFPQLPPGSYQVAPSMPGAQFSPALRNVTLSLQNADGVDFQVGGLTAAEVPQIQFVSPASTFAGIGSFSIRVLGNNFTPSSVISIGGRTLQTAFVDSTELRAVFPSALLTQAGRLTLAVVTPPPGGGSSASVDFTVVSVPQNPLIAGRAGVGSFPSGVAIDNTRNTVLVTNQSDDSVSVIDLTSLKSVAEIPVGRSPAEGIAISKQKDVAVVANPGSDNVHVIDLKTNKVTAVIPVGAFPIGVAIDAQRNRALVVNGEGSSVSVIDLNSLAVTGTIPVGNRPVSIAVNARTSQAVVTNRGSNTVTVIDLNSNAPLGTLAVGSYPRGVAINPDTNQALVANANGGTVSLIDLATRTVLGTISVGTGPTGVVIHTLTNFAVITNSGVTGGSTALPAQTTVTVLDLTARALAATIPVGSAAFGVDVDQSSQTGVIADYGSNDIIVIRIPNPKPRVDDIQPRTFPAGGGSFTITVTGVGFLPTSVVTLNGITLPTTYVSFTQLKAQITAAILDQLLNAGGTASRISALGSKDGGEVFRATTNLNLSIGVSNPGPGGGQSDPEGSSVSGGGTLQAENAVPVLNNISPKSIAADRDLALELTGKNFNQSSTVNFGNLQISAASSTPSSITIFVPKAQLTPGTVQVSVTNPPLGGGTSASMAFKIDEKTNPAPSIESVSPSSVASGSGSVTVTVLGSGFIDSTQSQLGGVAGRVSGNTLVFNVPAAQTQNAGTLAGTINNPTPGGGSAAFSFNILNGVPAVTGFSPKSALVGDAVLLTVTGTNFSGASSITVQGTPIPTTFVSPTSLTAGIPDSFMQTSGNVQIGATNPSPGGGSASGGIFSIASPLPTLTGITPARAVIQEADLTIQLSGTGFAGNSVAGIAGGAALVTTFNSRTSLTAVIPAAGLQQTGTLQIIVTNPPPGGGTSTPLPLPVDNPVPAITTVSPPKFAADRTDVVLEVAGANFVRSSTITVGKLALQTTFVSSTRLTAPLPPPLPLGTQIVTVVTPAPGGGTSNGFPIEITPLTPTITAVTPARAALGQTISVTGTNFGTGTTLLLRGQTIETTVVGRTSLTAAIPLAATTGSADLVARNPATATDAAVSSAPFTIELINPVPVITKLDPASVQPNLANLITIRGTGFVSTSRIQAGTAAMTTTFVDATTLTFTLPPTVAASVDITVVNSEPGGGTSNVAKLAVANPVPTITSLDPSSVQANQTGTVTIQGTGFLATSQVRVGATSVTAALVNSETMTFSLPGNLEVGSVNVTVTNPAPGGGISNSMALTVTSPPPTLTGLSQSSGVSGSSITLNVVGTNFVNGAVINFGGQLATTFLSSSALSATVTLGAAGTVAVTVTNPGGLRSNALSFTIMLPPPPPPPAVVVAPAPTLTQISPNSGAAGTAVNVTLTGTNFVIGLTSVVASGTGVTVSSINVSSSTTLTATFTINSGAATGSRNVTVTTSSGTSGSVGFTIGSGNAPTLTSISPSSAVAGSTITVTFAGTNFVPGATFVLADATTLPVTVISGTSMTATIVVLGSPGTRNVTVTTTNGTSGSVTFTVNSNALSTAGVFSVSTFVGSVGSTDSEGGVDGLGGSAHFNSPNGLAGDGSGNLFVADRSHHTIRKVVLGTQTVSTPAGSKGTHGTSDGTGTGARFNQPRGVWSDGINLYIADYDIGLIRKMVLGTAVVTTLVTSGTFVAPFGIWGDGTNLYVSDKSDHTIRKVVIATGVATIIAGVANSSGSADGGLGTSKFDQPYGVWGDGANLYVTDANNHTIRKIVIASGMVSTIAGQVGSSGTTDAIGLNAKFNFPTGIWSDGTQLFIVEGHNNLIRAIQISTLAVTTVAGSTSAAGSADGTGTAAKFNEPHGIWGDGTNLYVSDTGNHTIRQLTAQAPSISSMTPSSIPVGGSITATIVGTNFPTGTIVGVSGSGVTGGTVTVSSSTSLTVTFTATSGAATGSRTVTVVTGAGSATTTLTVVAVSTVSSFSQTTSASLGEGSTVPIQITGTGFISGVTAVSLSGTGVIVTGVEVVNSTTLNVGLVLLGAPGSRTITVTTGGVTATGTPLSFTISDGPGPEAGSTSHFAGSTGGAGSSNGTGTAARFKAPSGIWSDGSGNLYIADRSNYTIRKLVVATGVVSTIAGSPGVSGFTDGTGSSARFNSPEGIWGNGAGNLYVTDAGNFSVRKIVISTGAVSTVAGNGTAATTDGTGGTGGTARFKGPSGITGDASFLYVTDSVDHVIRKIDSSGTPNVTTFAGSAGTSGSANGTTGARFNSPHGIVLVGSDLYVADTNNHTIRKVDSGATVTTVAGSAGVSGSADGLGGARFNLPYGITTENGTNIFVGDSGNNEVRYFSVSDHTVLTLAGSTTAGFADASGSSAGFNNPQGVGSDGTNIFVADSNNSVIRKIIISGAATTTLAGSVNVSGLTNSTTASSVRFNAPHGGWADGSHLYVADTSNHQIRSVNSSTGATTVLAGDSAGSSGSGFVDGSEPKFNEPWDVWGDGAGNLYVTDRLNNRIRKIVISTGVASTIAGNGSGSTDGIGTNALFTSPKGLWGDGVYLYVTDTGNHTIRRINLATSQVTTLAGSAGNFGFTNNTGSVARFNAPEGIWGDGLGNLYVTEANHAVRKIVIATGAVTTFAGGTQGSSDSGELGAQFNQPAGIWGDRQYLYVVDSQNHSIRRIDRSNAVVTTFVGAGVSGADDSGSPNQVRFNTPWGIWNSGDDIFIMDTSNNCIRRFGLNHGS